MKGGAGAKRKGRTPGMGMMSSPWASNHARASWEGLHPFFAAISSKACNEITASVRFEASEEKEKRTTTTTTHLYDLIVLVKCLLRRESRQVGSEIPLDLEVLVALEPSGEEPPPEGRVGNDLDTELASGGKETVRFDLEGPGGVLNFDEVLRGEETR